MPAGRRSTFLLHLLVLASLVLVSGFLLAPPLLWKLPVAQLGVLAGLAGAYLVAVGVEMRFRQSGMRPSAVRAGLLAIAATSICVLVLVITESRYPAAFPDELRRAGLLAALILGAAGMALWSMPRVPSLLKVSLFGLIVIAGLVGQAAIRKGWWPPPVQPSYSTSLVRTSLYELRVEEFKDWVPRHWRMGGGLASWSQGYLVATGNGELYRMSRGEGGRRLEVTALPYTVPLNADEFKSGAQEVFRFAASKHVDASRFRVADVLVQERDGSVRVLVSHHYWKVSDRCFVLRISVLEGTVQGLLDPASKLAWRTLYETQPCLKLNTDSPRGPRFEGLENGGRMVLLDDDELLFTVGDHGFDGVNRPEALAQDPDAAYGKILRVRISSGEATVFSLGHRNPQGLVLAEDGVVWETEHGPQGGDEINVIREGANYGWPRTTYGTDYGRHSWPLNAKQGRHEGYEEPVFSFVPAVGISNVVVADGERFERWRGDLLIGSLKQQALYRARVSAERASVVEPVPLGRRVRDIAIGEDGRIVIWTDDYSLMFIEPTEATEGDALLAQCSACHSFIAGHGSTALGPNLHSIVGRPVASRTDFAYSEALREAGGRWTRTRLDRFLAAPQAEVPGTLMQFAGIPDAAERARLIDYLERMPVE